MPCSIKHRTGQEWTGLVCPGQKYDAHGLLYLNTRER